jgi:hypothetical protein
MLEVGINDRLGTLRTDRLYAPRLALVPISCHHGGLTRRAAHLWLFALPL